MCSRSLHVRAAVPLSCLVRYCRIAALALIGTGSVAQAQDTADKVALDGQIVMGVRTDAQPFAWRDKTTGAYHGYLRDICVEAARRSGYSNVDEVPVSALQRVAILEGNPFIVGEDKSVKEVDVLCDPITISIERIRTLNSKDERLVFSPILFVANGAFMTRHGAQLRDFPATRVDPKDEPDKGKAAAQFKAVEDMQKAAGCAWRAKSGRPFDPNIQTEAARTYLRAGYLVGTTAEASAKPYLRDARAAVDLLCLSSQISHSDAVAALCKGDLDLYFGDLDIIEAYRRDYSDETGEVCVLDPGSFVLTYEPYALLISNRTEGFRQKFILALYEMFSDGTAARIFGGYFSDHAKSTALNILFRINSIPTGTR